MDPWRLTVRGESYMSARSARGVQLGVGRWAFGAGVGAMPGRREANAEPTFRYLLKPYKTRWEDGIVGLEGGESFPQEP